MERYKDIATLIADRCWDKRMRAGGLDGYANYSGPNYSDYVIALSLGRDSDLVSESNFYCLLDTLGKRGGGVIVTMASHWACGWVKTIMVKKTAKAKLKTLLECLNALADYPVLDDSDYSEREAAKADEDYEFYKADFMDNVCKFLGVESVKATDAQWDAVLLTLYREDCSYRGIEEAYVTDDAIQRCLNPNYKHVFHSLESNPIVKALRAKVSA